MRQRTILNGIMSASVFLAAYTGQAQENGRLPVMSDQASRAVDQSGRLLLQSQAQKVIQKSSAQNKTATALVATDVLVNNNPDCGSLA